MFWKAKRSHSNSYDSVTRKMYLFLANVTNRATSRGRCRFSLEGGGGKVEEEEEEEEVGQDGKSN